jgi:transcriptional regulator with XRE-family HTH domain
MMIGSQRPAGELIREWRQRRRMTQLDLACEAEISTRHLSFLETGRAQPSREMVLHLAEQLDLPLRERNVLLLAAGYAPAFPERRLDDPAMRPARAAIDRLLAAHEPFPAMVVDRHWTLVAANDAVRRLLHGIDAALLQPPVNVLRLSVHPNGLAPRIASLAEWRGHLLARLRRQLDASGDPVLSDLLREIAAYEAPAGSPHGAGHAADDPGVIVPLRLITPAGTLSFLSTITVFGTPMDITLSELALESFFPADTATADALRANLPRERRDAETLRPS